MPPVEILPVPKPKERLPEQTQQQKMDTEIIKQSVAAVEEHKDQFRGLSQEQSNDLISKLLYDRLIAVPSKRLVGRPVLNKQPKQRPSTIQRPISMKPKKKQYQMIQIQEKPLMILPVVLPKFIMLIIILMIIVT